MRRAEVWGYEVSGGGEALIQLAVTSFSKQVAAAERKYKGKW